MKNIKFIHFLAIFALIILLVLVKDFIGVIIFSIVTVFFAYPIYEKSFKKFKKKWLSLIITWGSILLTLTIPIAFLGIITFNQTSLFIDDIWELITAETSIQELIQDNSLLPTIETISEKVSDIWFEIQKEKIYTISTNIITTIWNWLTSVIVGLVNSIFSIILNLLIFFIVTTGLILHRQQTLEYIKQISPLERKQTETYLSRIWNMIGAIIKWTFLIAIIQWLITGISFAITGVPYTMFWTILVSFLSLIPFIWAWVIAVPIAIIFLLMGNVWEWIFLLVVNMLIVWNIDTVLRPVFIWNDTKINPAILILSLFGGIALFGIIGIFYWPIIMVFILTTIEFYIQETNQKNLIWEK